MDRNSATAMENETVNKQLADQKNRMMARVRTNNGDYRRDTPCDYTPETYTDEVVVEMCNKLNDSPLFYKMPDPRDPNQQKTLPVYYTRADSKKGFACPVCEKGNYHHLTRSHIKPDDNKTEDLHSHIMKNHPPPKVEYSTDERVDEVGDLKALVEEQGKMLKEFQKKLAAKGK